MADANVVAAEIAAVSPSSEPAPISRRSNASSMHSGTRDRCEPAGLPLVGSILQHLPMRKIRCGTCTAAVVRNAEIVRISYTISVRKYLAEPCTTRAQRFCFRRATDSTSCGSSSIFMSCQKNYKSHEESTPRDSLTSESTCVKTFRPCAIWSKASRQGVLF